MADLGTATGRRRPRIRTVAIVAAVLIGLAGLAACVDLFRFSAEHNRRLIDALPARARTAYLDAVFDRPDPACAGCRFRVAVAVDAVLTDLLRHRGSYRYDVTPLLPLLKNGVAFGGRVGGAACLAVLAKNDKAVLEKLARLYNHDPYVLERCLVPGLRGMRGAQWPDYNQIDGSVLSMPALALFHEVWNLAEYLPPTPEPIGYAQMDDHGMITLLPRRGAAFQVTRYAEAEPERPAILTRIEPFDTPDPGQRIYIDRALPPPHGKTGATPGIDQSLDAVSDTFERRFPCCDAGMKLWQAPRAPATAPPITIQLSIPILDAKQDPDIDISLPTPPDAREVMRYLFPYWRGGPDWLVASLGHARTHFCPRIVHFRDIWIVVVKDSWFVGRYTAVTITRDPWAVAEVYFHVGLCDVPPIEELGMM